MVTGLTVNTKVNIPAYYLRSARAMCNSLFQIGTYHLPSDDGILENFKPLEGILSHIYRVKRSAVLARRPPKSKDSMKVPSEELYRRFLFCKYFVGLDRPLIVCEGKTDNIYLKYAICDRVALWPQLGEVDGVSVRIKVNFFSYKSTVQNILDLTGGSSKIHKFLNQFGDHLSRYAHRPLGHPVIVVVDNDDGLTAQLKTDLKKHFDVDIGLLSTQPFYRLANNIYLIKTPEAGASGISCIEDCFDPSTRSIRLDGKAFNPAKKIDVTTEYGKAPFAEKVVIPNAKQISWDGFDPLLARIDAVISDYKPPALTVVARAA
jgi:RNA-directed DNA polymerase